MINYIALGKKIRKVRIEHNYTQRQLAIKLHFSVKHLGNIERGNARPSLECLVDISIALNISIEYLLSDSLPPQSYNYSNEFALTVEHFLTQQQFEIQQLQQNIEILKNA